MFEYHVLLSVLGGITLVSLATSVLLGRRVRCLSRQVHTFQEGSRGRRVPERRSVERGASAEEDLGPML